jgi:hypothetical protein
MTYIEAATKHLPPPILERYIININKFDDDRKQLTCGNDQTVGDVIENSFKWSWTPEGESYWLNLKRKYSDVIIGEQNANT